MSEMSTSRVARKPISLPAGVDVKVQNGTVVAKGPKGSLTLLLHPFTHIVIEDGSIQVQLKQEEAQFITGSTLKLYKSIAGTVRSNIYNVIVGVTTGFERKLHLIGVGYKAQAKGKVLNLSLGYSHPTDFVAPEGVTLETPTQTEVVIKGADKRQVGEVAAQIRAMRPPELYKGKGIRYANEIIELKETKKK